MLHFDFELLRLPMSDYLVRILKTAMCRLSLQPCIRSAQFAPIYEINLLLFSYP